MEWCVSVKKYFVVNIIRKKYMKPDNNIPYIFFKKILLKIFIHRVLRINSRFTHMFVLCPIIFDFRELLELGTFWTISLSPLPTRTHYPASQFNTKIICTCITLDSIWIFPNFVITIIIIYKFMFKIIFIIC